MTCLRNIQRGYSSAGRALAWHARGQRFDPAYLHQNLVVVSEQENLLSPSSRGLGHHPFTVSTGVRIPLGTPVFLVLVVNRCGAVVQLVRIPACHAGGRGFESRPLRQHTAIAKKQSSQKATLIVAFCFFK